MIHGMFDYGALPALQRLAQFTSHRHKVLANNIANLSTPYFKPADLDPGEFQRALGQAIDDRRRSPNPVAGPLDLRDTDQLRFGADRLIASPKATHENILFHDQNNRDVDRLMQRLAENTIMHNAAVELIRNQVEMLRTAIRERV
jgi:flagellar basal-body rod protein FlgB